MNLDDQIAATAELCGAPLSKPALAMLSIDLESYPPSVVSAALRRCRMEHRGRLTAEAIISRIDDGRPGPEEAWAMIPRDEWASVVWTDEMAKANAAASSLLADGDPIAARMAFKEVYQAEVSKSRDAGKPANWYLSAGFDKSGRESAVREAVDMGRLTMAAAQKYLPDLGSGDGSDQTMKVLALASQSIKRVKR